MSEAPDLSRLGVRSLLTLIEQVIDELLKRGLVSTRDKPLGGIAERVVALARAGRVERNSAKSYDVIASDGRLIQVKAMGVRAAGSGGKFGQFRSFDFDTAVFLVFDGAFDLVLARELLPDEVLALARLSNHTAARQPTLSKIRGAGVDVTDEMRAAYERISGAGGT